MAGITSYGAYIPIYRLKREEIARAWGGGTRGGEKAVANWDEDSLTMGVEAAINCLNAIDRGLIDSLYFASTTPPYREKQSASILAAGADLRKELITADFADSIRAGASAVRAALDAINAGSANRVLVVASDCRLPAPSSEFESIFGDGAAALLIGDSEVAVDVEDSYSLTSEFIDVWRREHDRYSRTWEDRFVLTHGYHETTVQVVNGLLQKGNLKPTDFTKVVIYAPNTRSHTALVRALGFDLKTQVQDPLLNTVGDTGAAGAMMMLVAALEEAKPGDKILWVSYGDGADAFILKVKDNIEKLRDRRGIKSHLTSKMALPNYETYLRFRNLMEWEPERRPQEEGSLNVLWRERRAILSGRGQRCRRCGHVQFPMQRVCMWCQTKDEFDEVRLSDKKGTIFTFSMDERAMVTVLPNVLVVADLDGGGRFYSQMTDRDPEKIEVGMPVELTFRKINEAGGIHNYFWKCRPVRG